MVRFSKTRKNPARCIGNYSVYLLFLMPPAGLSPYWSSTAFPSRRDVGIREKLFESCTKSRRRLLSRISKYASLFTYAPGRTLSLLEQYSFPTPTRRRDTGEAFRVLH